MSSLATVGPWCHARGEGISPGAGKSTLKLRSAWGSAPGGTVSSTGSTGSTGTQAPPTAAHVVLIIKSHVSEATRVYEAAQHTGMELFSLPRCLK